MQRVLITGGSGFLGSNLVEALLKKNYIVMVISRKTTNLTHLLGRIEFVELTSGYREHADKIRSFSPTTTIHCAWAHSNKYAEVNNLSQFQNIGAGLELIDALPKGSMFLGVGSFAEYGKLVSRATEQMVDAPVTMYGLSKSSFKSISNMVCQQAGIRWGWIRPCYIYGRNDVHTRLIPSLISKFLSKTPVTLDSCTVKIDYLHVDDFCSGVLAILESSSDGIFNICSGEEYDLKKVIELVKICTDSTSDITYDSSLDRILLSKYTCGDNTALRSLGWSPTIGIEKGIRELVVSQKMTDLDGLHMEA